MAIELTAEQVDLLEQHLISRGYFLKEVPYARFSYTKPGISVTVYNKSFKLLVQGKLASEFMEFDLVSICGLGVLKGECVAAEKNFVPHFGIDESGKGDYFGPLVIAGVYADEEMAKQLKNLGVCDSKAITSAAGIRKLAKDMRDVRGLEFQVVSIGPERYNEVYESFKNLNTLLAWGHSRVIELLQARVPACTHTLSDQFARESVLQQMLKRRGIVGITLEQRTRAESDLVVAAASIFARERFIDWMDSATKAMGFKMPLGASPQVITAGREVLARGGDELLAKVAKLHFKTTGIIKNGE